MCPLLSVTITCRLENTMLTSYKNNNEDFQNLKTLIIAVFALIVVPKYTA